MSNEIDSGNLKGGPFTVSEADHAGNFVFNTGGVEKIIEMKSNGDFYFKGMRVENDYTVYLAFKAFFAQSGFLPTYHDKVNSEHGDTQQTLNLMHFGGAGLLNCDCVLGHVGMREFRRAVLAKYPDWNGEAYYEYAIFRDDEAALFNARPDDTDAKPITIAYYGPRVGQP